RIGAAVADHVPPLVAARAFHAHLTLAGRRTEVAHDLGQNRTVGYLRERLAQDPGRLFHLVDPHHVAVHRVANRTPLPMADWNVELEVGIGRVRHVLAHVPFDAARAQVGSDQIVVDRLFGAYRGDVG